MGRFLWNTGCLGKAHGQISSTMVSFDLIFSCRTAVGWFMVYYNDIKQKVHLIGLVLKDNAYIIVLLQSSNMEMGSF